MTTSYQKISGFDRPHVSEMLWDSKNFHSGERIKKFPDLLANSPYACRPDLTQSIKILSYDHRGFPYFLFYYFFSGNKISSGMFTYVAHFNRKVGIYITTMLFQFTSRKEPSNPSRTNGFFWPCTRTVVIREFT